VSACPVTGKATGVAWVVITPPKVGEGVGAGVAVGGTVVGTGVEVGAGAGVAVGTGTGRLPPLKGTDVAVGSTGARVGIIAVGTTVATGVSKADAVAVISIEAAGVSVVPAVMVVVMVGVVVNPGVPARGEPVTVTLGETLGAGVNVPGIAVGVVSGLGFGGSAINGTAS